MEPVDTEIAGLLKYRPMERSYRPVVMIPGQKPIVASREYTTFSAAQEWAAGFVRGPGRFIKEGTVVNIGETTFTVIGLASGLNRLQFLGPVRAPGDK